MKRHQESNVIFLGNFHLTQPVARISDPCYDKDTWCAGTVKGCEVGEWKSNVISFDEGEWGNRNGYLVACVSRLDSIPDPHDSRWSHLEIDVGVDSGQAGIFDEKFYKDDDSIKGVERLDEDGEVICEDEPWYSICCDRTLQKKGAGVIPYGVVSSSGYGDGGYDAYAIKDSMGEVIALMIDFGIDASKEDEDEDEDEEDEMVQCDNCGQEVDVHELRDGLCDECYEENELEIEGDGKEDEEGSDPKEDWGSIGVTL